MLTKVGRKLVEWWNQLWGYLAELFQHVWALASLPIRVAFGVLDILLDTLVPALFWLTVALGCFLFVLGVMAGGEVPLISGYLARVLGDVTLADMLPWLLPMLRQLLGGEMSMNITDTPAHLAISWVVAGGTVAVIVIVLTFATRAWASATKSWHKALLVGGALLIVGLAFAGEVYVLRYAVQQAEKQTNEWNLDLGALKQDVLYATEIPSPDFSPEVSVSPPTPAPGQKAESGKILPLIALIAILAFAKVFEGLLTEGGILAIMRAAPWWQAFWLALRDFLRVLFSEIREMVLNILLCALAIVRLTLPILLPAALLAGLILIAIR